MSATRQSCLVCLDQIDPPSRTQFPDGPLSLVLGRVGDFCRELGEQERSIVDSSCQKRKEQFSSGRRVAKFALNQLGTPTQAIVQRAKFPEFPENYVGSIAHANRFAFAGVGQQDRYQGIGVDILPSAAVSVQVATRVLLDEERETVASLQNTNLRTAFFCAKEAVFKAMYPLTRQYFGFMDVRISFSWDLHSFHVSSTGSRLEPTIAESGVGYVDIIAGHYLTLFVVER